MDIFREQKALPSNRVYVRHLIRGVLSITPHCNSSIIHDTRLYTPFGNVRYKK